MLSRNQNFANSAIFATAVVTSPTPAPAGHGIARFAEGHHPRYKALAIFNGPSVDHVKPISSPFKNMSVPVRARKRPPTVSRLEPRLLLSAGAVNVPLLDPGFEALTKPGAAFVTATLAPGTETRGAGPGVAVIDSGSGNPATVQYSDGTLGSVVDVPGWTGYADRPVGIAGPGNAYPSNSDNYAYVGPGYAIRQVLAGLVLQPRTTYVLTARVGSPAGSPTDAIQLTLGGSGVAAYAPATFQPGNDGFTTVTAYAKTDVSVAAAADVSVVLGAAPNATAALAFDDVTLTEMPVTPMTAAISAPDVTAAGSEPEAVTVTYSDETPIEVSSISPANLSIADPTGRPLAVTGVTIGSAALPGGFANAVTATYAVAAPTGGWGNAVNGAYTISLRTNSVLDAVSTSAPATSATFLVTGGQPAPTPAPSPAPTPTPAPLPTGTLAASLAAKLPPAIVSGARAAVSASVTVTNPMAAAQAAGRVSGRVSGPVTVALGLSPDASLDAAQRIAAVTRRLRLNPGRGSTIRIKVPRLPALADGRYTLIATVTAPDGTLTAVAGPTLRVAAPFVSAKVSAVRLLSMAGRVSAGARVGVALTVTNQGNVPATGDPTLAVSIAPSAGPQAGGSRVIATVLLTVRLRPGAARSYRVWFVLPPASPTTYDVTATLGVGALGDYAPSDGVATASGVLVVS